MFRAYSVNYNMYFYCMQLDITVYYCSLQNSVLYHLVWSIVCSSLPAHLLNFVTALIPYVLLPAVFLFECYWTVMWSVSATPVSRNQLGIRGWELNSRLPSVAEWRMPEAQNRRPWIWYWIPEERRNEGRPCITWRDNKLMDTAWKDICLKTLTEKNGKSWEGLKTTLHEPTWRTVALAQPGGPSGQLQRYTGRHDGPSGWADVTSHRVGFCSAAF